MFVTAVLSLADIKLETYGAVLRTGAQCDDDGSDTDVSLQRWPEGRRCPELECTVLWSLRIVCGYVCAAAVLRKGAS